MSEPATTAPVSVPPAPEAPAAPPSAPAAQPPAVQTDPSVARLAELEARVKASDEIMGKMRTLFGGEPEADPAQQAADLKAQSARDRAFAARAIVAAATAQCAAKDVKNETALADLIDHVVAHGTVEIDWTTGRPRDPSAVSIAVSAERASRDYLFITAAPPPGAPQHAVPLVGKTPAPPMPKAPERSEQPKMSSEDLMFGSLSAVRSYVATGTSTKM